MLGNRNTVSNSSSGLQPLDRRRRACSTNFAALIVLTAFLGCSVVDKNQLSGKSPLSALEKAPDQAHLEVLFVRIPQPDFEMSRQLWDEVDEQAIPAHLRRQLNQNGFRVGVLGSQLPPRIAAVVQAATSVDGGATGTSDTSVEGSVGATRRQLFLRSGQRGELIASSVQPEFHVLQTLRGELHGSTFKDGQGQFTIKAAPSDDGRVKIHLAPEVHYGEFRKQYVPGEGMFKIDTSRRKQMFSQLQIEANLTTGQIIVIGAQPDQPGSLGHRFFNEQAASRAISKLLMIRVGEVGVDRHDELDDLIAEEP